MIARFSEKILQRIARIDTVVNEYLNKNNIEEIPAKDLMTLFIKEGIFLKDPANGLYIRRLLRQLDKAKKLQLLKQVKVIRHAVNRNWYFVRR